MIRSTLFSTFAALAFLMAPVASAGDLATCDFDGDGSITEADVEVIKSIYGAKEGDEDFNPDADLDGDGLVFASDLAAFIRLCTSN